MKQRVPLTRHKLNRRTFVKSIGVTAFATMAGTDPKSATLAAPSERFSLEDFVHVEKIDSHVHVNSKHPTFLEQAIADKFKVLTLNTAWPTLAPIEQQKTIALLQKTAFPGRLAFATTFSMEGWDHPDWLTRTIKYLEESFRQGAIAVKIWKNIGMEVRDKEGRFLMIDDPRCDPLFEFLAREGIPVVGHQGEPKNCWLPVDEMTIRMDQQYFSNNPQYHMYLHPEYPSYELQLEARNQVLRKHPRLRFIGCHLASLEWSVEELGKTLDAFPNLAVDTAARICHLQLQTMQDWEKVRDFLIQYQDRVLYGTDLTDRGAENPEELKKDLHKTWLEDWKYFVTDETLSSPYFDGEFRGLALPREVVEKVYRKNARAWYPGI